MNNKVLLTTLLAVALVGGGTLGLLAMDSDNSEGALGSLSDSMYQGDTWKKEVMMASGGNRELATLGDVPEGFSWKVVTPGQMNKWELTATPTQSKTYNFTVYVVPQQDQGWSISLEVKSNTQIDFTNPSSIDMVVGDGLNYQLTTNIPSTITKQSGASWITLDAGNKAVGTCPSPGTHTATFLATSTDGPVQTATQTVTIHAYDVLAIGGTYDNQPIATQEFTYSPTVNINATISVSGLPTGAIFQDGAVRWVPINAGNYEFTVSAISSEGPLQVSEITVSVTVYPVLSFSSLPKADLVVIPNGATVQLYSMSTGATSVLWEFSDGQTSDEWYPEMTFSEGEVTGTLTAFNDLGEDVKEFTLNITGGDSDEGMDFDQFIDEYGLVIVGIVIFLIVVGFMVRRK